MSRAVAHRHRVPGPEMSRAGFVEGVNAAIRADGYEVVFGAGDAEVLALSALRAEIEAEIPYAEHPIVVRSHDKLELTRAAEAVGLSTPRTAEASEHELGSWSPPFLVKASLHASPSGQGDTARLEAELFRDRATASGRAQEIRAAGSVPFLQEVITGDLFACALVSDRDGSVIASTAQLAEGTWPPRVGATSRARTVELDPELRSAVRDLVGELGWFGLAHLQFMLPAAGEPRLIDLNGRFYGSLPLAVASGANLPAIWAALATGRTPPRAETRAGTTFQWLEGDFRRALSERRGGLLADLWSSATYARGAAKAVWSVRDPAPMGKRLGRLPRQLLGRYADRRR